jgi:3-phosphoshikimate 1-carboxyvinyltransferase
MAITIGRGGQGFGGVTRVPGDKSIAHRWLILAATALGRSEIRGLPLALDVRSTAKVCAALLRGRGGAVLDGWGSNPSVMAHGDGSTANNGEPRPGFLAIEGRGRPALEAPTAVLDCENSGTTMRLLTGVLAAAPFRSVLVGDPSLTPRPMERLAEPLRAMGARIETDAGHAPLAVEGGVLHGIAYRSPVPSAQVKSAVLFAALAADGLTTVTEPASTRDHTERALEALGAPITVGDDGISVERFQHEGFGAAVPGDLSSAAFLLAAAFAAGGRLEVEGVGLNPTRAHVLAILERMGAGIQQEVEGRELGEPVGALTLDPRDGPRGTVVTAEELPLVIDEVPVLAAVAATAEGPSRFEGAGELRVKESDRLAGTVDLIRALGGDVALEGDDLVVGGGGLAGGATVDPRGDHRMAMAGAVAACASERPVTISDARVADVSFPGAFETLASLGADVGGLT